MRAISRLGSSHGGVAVSKTADRGSDSFRACFNEPGRQPGHPHLDNYRGIVDSRSVATTTAHGSVAAWRRSWL